MTRVQNPLALEFILLGFIAQGPIHGYDLYKKMCEADGISLVWRVKQSHLYALLDKLVINGMLTTKIVAGDVFPSRKEFKITEKGRNEVHAWLTSPVHHGRDLRQEFLAKIFFAKK